MDLLCIADDGFAAIWQQFSRKALLLRYLLYLVI